MRGVISLIAGHDMERLLLLQADYSAKSARDGQYASVGGEMSSSTASSAKAARRPLGLDETLAMSTRRPAWGVAHHPQAAP
jgi:hypothetical protein